MPDLHEFHRQSIRIALSVAAREEDKWGAQLTSRRRQGGLSLLFSFSLLLLLAAGAILVYELVAFSRREELLPSGYHCCRSKRQRLERSGSGLSVGKAPTRSPWSCFIPDALGGQPHPIRLHPDQIGWRISSDPMLADALASGETGGGFWRRFLDYLLGNELVVSRELTLLADYQSYALEAFLLDLALRYDNPPGSPGYDLQTLTVYRGRKRLRPRYRRRDGCHRQRSLRSADLSYSRFAG